MNKNLKYNEIIEKQSKIEVIMSINLDNLDEEVKNKILKLQNLQQTLGYLTNQIAQIEVSFRETGMAIEELEKTGSDDVVYKSIGGILVKSNKDRLLDEKKSLKVTLEMRLKSFKQKSGRLKSETETLTKSLQTEFQNK